MRTIAARYALENKVVDKLIICGGSNFGVRYDDQKVFGDQHPTQKTAIFTFEAFARSDFWRKSEAAVIKDALVKNFCQDAGKIFAEMLSATTEENVEFLKIILRRRPMFTGNERIAVLTQLYQMGKALPIFQKAGIVVEPLFVESVLVTYGAPENEWLLTIYDYYKTPKGGKQYPIEKLLLMLSAGESLSPLMS
jgi:hypothetical protein